ncbi:MAG: DNA polymerase III subunit alpha [Ignavibacteria bacterium]|nr:DNA polymerase III subunit alpha [Ignavibacteria bacterium]
MQSYIHLHNHSHYSLLDGAATVEGLVQAAVANKMQAVALTDHGVLSGAIEFYKKALKAGVKPIIGFEAYIVTKGSRYDKGSSGEMGTRGRGKAPYHHILLLAKDETGYKNLVKLSTLGYTEGFYYKPRIDLELLAKFKDGIVATSACPGGVVSASLANDAYDEALEVAGLYRDLFGEDFYIEIQNHGLDIEVPILKHAPRLAKELGLKLVATNDVHYIERDHALPHNIMLLIPDASSTNSPDYMSLRYKTDQLYFKSAQEMGELFKEFPQALRSTVEIVEKCNLELDLKRTYMPRFPIPDGLGAQTLEEYLDRLTRERIKERYPVITPEITERLDYELSVIKGMQYAGYFLIVQDFINAARAMGVRVGPGRGSAAGSLVSYALGITDVDPLYYGLLFERFLNPERISMPDIDVDFSDDRREKVIQYVREKYGADSVSQIITFGTLSSRAVLKDVGRVLGIPLSTIESITKQIPVIQGKVPPLAEAIETIPDLRWVKESKDEQIRMMVDAALVLEGMNRNASTHAAGVVIAPGDISDYVPLYKTPQTELVTQYNMKDLEDAGLLKMDFLGLRTLTVLENALALIKDNHGIDLDLDKLPVDDQKTFELFSKGQTVAMFQFESSGMQDYLRKLKPTVIHDLVAMNALYRPGPMQMIDDFIARKHGRQQINYLHPKLEGILKETYGIIVYQEQVMRIASEIAGLSLAKADLMRRAMGKKDKLLMAEQKKEFITGALAKGIDKRIASEIFDLIEQFASYGFNKSHSVAYTVLAYQTAYLKAHYPAEYMAATLTSEIGDTDKIVLFIDECRKIGIDVLPPDVNESGVKFSVTPTGIRFGLSAIKNVGVGAVEQIVQAREAKGRFKDIFDFAARVDLRSVNKKTMESLIQSGAFDSLHSNRAQLYESVEKAIAYGQTHQEAQGMGQSSLFDSPTARILPRVSLPGVPTWTEAEKLSREKTVLGFYVSGHPLLKFEAELEGFATATFGSCEGIKPNSIVRLGGVITAVKKKIDKRGNMMAFVTLEDFTGKGECIVFSDPFQKYGEYLRPEAMIFVVGKADISGESLKILVNEVIPIEQVRDRLTKRINLRLDLDRVDEQTIVELRQILERHRGSCACYFTVAGGSYAKNSLYLTRRFVVAPTQEFMDSVTKLLGAHAIRLEG